MVNEERLRHMIKIARFDANEGKQCKPMTQYARKDYIAMQLLGSFVTGTLCYVLLLGLCALYFMTQLLEEINRIDIRSFLFALLFGYVVFLLFYLGATYVIFHMRYTNGRRKVKKYYGSLKKINQMYERDDRLKRTGKKDWE